MRSTPELDNLEEAIENPKLRNPTWLYPTWLKQDASCFVNGIGFFKHPKTGGFTSSEGLTLLHNGEAITEIVEILGNENRPLRTASNKVPVFVKTASGKRRMMQASRNENKVLEIESDTLISQAPSDIQWLSFHNISFDEREGLRDELGTPVFIDGHQVKEVVFRDGSDILVELDDESTAWIRIAETKFVTILDEQFPIGRVSFIKSEGSIKQLPAKTIGVIQGKKILQGQDGKVFVEGGYELIINSKKIKEVGYIEGNKLLVELVDGSEIGVLLEKNQVIQKDIREKVGKAIAA